MNNKHLFTSTRLGFRNWIETDIPKMIKISGNEEVMNFFPAVATPEQTTIFTRKLQDLFEEKGYCYFAVDELETGKFIGFIGFYFQDYESEFTPAVDIGWRLHPDFWGKGYATEGAKACLDYGKDSLKLKKVISTAPQINKPSINVMKKIGMKKKLEFIHPKVKENERLRNCVCYEIDFQKNPNFDKSYKI